MADASTILFYNLQPAPGLQQALNQQLSKIEQGLKLNIPFNNQIESIRNFTSELDRANQRVITLGLAFQTLRTTQQIFTGIVSSALEVEKAFTDINAVFDLSSKELDRFGKNLFNVARETSTSFKVAAEAAKEFSRQGLSSEETLQRTKNALTLSRVANLDVAKAVDVLTASINGFTKSALTSSEITNKLLAVDTRFAVSVRDLSEALARAGASASDAGVGFDELLGIITAVQQTTARGGAVIGQSLKTIFTRIERKDTLDSLEALGVKVRNISGDVLPATELLKNFASTYDKLGESTKKSAAELVGGVYQINILKAAVADLSRERSIYTAAVEASKNAGEEELIRNEALNKSLQSTIDRLSLAGKQIGSNVANLGFSSFAKTAISLFTENPVVKALEDASGQAETTGGKIAEVFIKGFGNTLVFGLGPILAVALSKISASTFSKIKTDLFEVAGLSTSSKDQLMIQEQINFLYKNGDAALKAQLATMTSLNDKAELLTRTLNQIQSRSAGVQSEIQAVSSIMSQKMGYRPIPRSAGGYIPFSEESAAISRGVGGALSGASPRLISNFNFGGGKVGPIVANTSEYVVPNFAGGGSAIFNQEMISRYGLPPGSMPIGAGGYIPYAAGGLSGQMDFESMGLRSSKGYTISSAMMKELEGLFNAIGNAGSGGKAREIGNAVIDLTEGLNKASQSKILKTLGKVYTQFDVEGGLMSQESRAIQKAIASGVMIQTPETRIAEEQIFKENALKKQAELQSKKLLASKAFDEMQSQRILGGSTIDQELIAESIKGTEAALKEYEMQRMLARQPREQFFAKFAKGETVPSEKTTGEFLKSGLGFIPRTRPEMFFRKDLYDLTTAGLSQSIGGMAVSSSDTERFAASQLARRNEGLQVYSRSGLNIENLNKTLNISSALASNASLFEQFNQTVQNNIKSGVTLTEAYKKAVVQLEANTDNQKEINNIIKKSQPINAAFQKTYSDSLETARQENEQRLKGIKNQAILNKANADIIAGGKFDQLSARERGVMKASMVEEAIAKAGFAGATYAQIRQDPLAKQQVDSAVKSQIALLNSSQASAASGGKLGFLGGLKQGINQNAGLIAAMGLPFIAGMIPEGRGGTGGGMALGALGGAFNGAGFGASLGSLLPIPGGALAGAGIGAGIGAITGALLKMDESFGEMTDRLDQISRTISNNFQSSINILNLKEQIREAEGSGQYATADTLKKQQTSLYEGITSKEELEILTNPLVTDIEKRKRLTDLYVKQSKEQQSAAAFTKIGQRSQRGFFGFATDLLGGDVTGTRESGSPMGINFGGIFSYFRDLLEDSSAKKFNKQGITAILSQKDKFSNEDLVKILKTSREGDPLEAFRTIGEKIGMGVEDIEKALKGVNTKILRESLLEGLSLASEFRKRRENETDKVERQKQMNIETILKNIDALSRGMFTRELSFSSGKQISDVKQRIALENPLVGNELSRLELTQKFQLENTQKEFQFRRQQEMDTSRKELLTYAAKTKNIGEKSAYDILGDIKGIEDVKRIRNLTTTEYGKISLGGIADKNFLELLDKIIASYDQLNETEQSNIKTIKAVNDELRTNIEYRRSLSGAIDLETKAIEDLLDQLSVAEQQNADSSIISDLTSNLNIANIMSLRRQGAATEGDVFRTKYMQGFLGQNRSQIRSSQAFIDAMANPIDREEYVKSETEKENQTFQQRLEAAKVQLDILKRIGATKEEINNKELEIKLNDIETLRKLGAGAGGITDTEAKIKGKVLMDTNSFTRQLEQNQENLEAAKRMNLDRNTVFDFETKTINDQIEEKRRLGAKAGGLSDQQADIETARSLARRTLAERYKGGAETQSALYGYAATRGKYGDSMESLTGGFGSVFAGLRKDMDQLADVGKNLADTLQSSLSGAFGDFITGAKTAKQAFRDFTVGVLADASRALASKAVQNLLGSFLGSFGTPAGATGGEFSGGAFRFASGGTVPALLTGGEYYISPKAAKSIGYDTLRQINRYAEGGMVRGGSGVRDDVPAHLPPGSFIVKKSVVDRLSPQYFDSLVNNHVQKKFFGGMLLGALLGGGLGYAVGGKKGALIGAGIGAIGGGLYQNFSQTGSVFGSTSTGASASATSGQGIPFEMGSAPSSQFAETLAEDAVRMNPFTVSAKGSVGAMSGLQKAGLMLGAAGILGIASRAMAPKEGPGAISLAQVPAYRAQLESQQQDQFSKNAFAYLSINPQGGYTLGSFGTEPATRRWAEGGEVGGVSNIGPVSSNSSQAPSVNVKIEINNNGQMSSSSSSSGQDKFGSDFGQRIEKAVRPIVQDEIVRQMRNDGIFMQKSRYSS